MIALLVLAEGDAVLHSRYVLLALLRCLLLLELVGVSAPWLGWILPLFQRLGECRDCVALRVEESCVPPVLVVYPVGVVYAWLVAPIPLSGVG